MNKSEKEKLYKMIDEKTKVISNPTTVYETIGIWANGFPKPLFEEWRKDCMVSYNDIYWTKIWTDHIKAKAYDIFVSNLGAVEDTEEKEEPREEVISLIGDGGK